MGKNASHVPDQMSWNAQPLMWRITIRALFVLSILNWLVKRT